MGDVIRGLLEKISSSVTESPSRIITPFLLLLQLLGDCTILKKILQSLCNHIIGRGERWQEPVSFVLLRLLSYFQIAYIQTLFLSEIMKCLTIVLSDCNRIFYSIEPKAILIQ